MTFFRNQRSCVACAALVFWMLGDAQAQLYPAGLEFQVNTDNQVGLPDVAMDAEGRSVVVWVRINDIKGQRYSPDSVPLGDEFLINTTTEGVQDGPRVGSQANGDFVVVWQSRPSGTFSDLQIFAQRFDSSGQPKGSEIELTEEGGFNTDPHLAVTVEGNFLVVWESVESDTWEIFGQRFSRDGSRLGERFQLNTYTTGRQEDPVASIDENGNFLVAWRDVGGSGGRDAITVQRFSRDGARLGSERTPPVSRALQIGGIAGDVDGGFIVAWSDTTSENLGPDSVWAQRYDIHGNALGQPIQVHEVNVFRQERVHLAAHPNGGTVLVWSSQNQDESGDGVFARHLESDGGFSEPEQQVNTYTPLNQSNPRISGDGKGDFLLVWWNKGNGGGPTASIQARQFSMFPPGIPTPTPTALPDDFERQVNTYTPGSQLNPSIASDAAGNTIIVWQSPESEVTTGIHGQRFDHLRNRLGQEFVISDSTLLSSVEPVVAADRVGNFVVVWQGSLLDDSNVIGRRFSSDGRSLAHISHQRRQG